MLSKKFWIIMLAILILTIIPEFFMRLHGHFDIEKIWFFNAWYGFLTCALIVVFSKLLGFVLKRKEEYYEE